MPEPTGQDTPPPNSASPAQTPPPAPAPAATPAGAADNLTAMLLSQLTEARTRAAELEAAERQRQAEAARKEQDLLAEKGNTEAAKQALQAAREAHDREIAAARAAQAETDRRSRTAFRDRELALALSGKPLVSEGAAKQLMSLLRSNLDAYPEGDSFAVRTADFVGVNDFVARELAKPDYAHFLRPTTTGGAGAQGGDRTTATPAPGNGDPAARRVAELRAAVSEARSGAPGLAGTYSNN